MNIKMLLVTDLCFFLLFFTKEGICVISTYGANNTG